MISSTSKRGGGPTHIFNLTNMLGNDFEFYFAMPETKDYVKLNKKNYIKISERKIKIYDLIQDGIVGLTCLFFLTIQYSQRKKFDRPSRI